MVLAEAAGRPSLTVTTPCEDCPIQASSLPRASNAAVTPVSAAWTAGRPVSAARTALSEACWSGPQVPWKVEVADWYTISCAPRSVSTWDMSGNADSKQISTLIGRGRPALSAAYIRCAPVPGIILDAAALLILVSQPSCCRNGMYL